MNPFDFWKGANFKIKIRMVEGYRNYDKSEFETPAPLFDNDSKLEAVYDGQHSLKAFLAPSNFKSYDTLKAKLDNVLGLSNNPNAPSIPATDIDEEFEAPRTPKEAGAPWKETVEASDDLDYFKKMLAQRKLSNKPKEDVMLETALLVLVGAFVGWHFPEPKWAISIRNWITNLFIRY